MPAEFPQTSHSILEDLREGDADARRQAFDALVRAYWKPTYKYVRIKWHADSDDAADLTQSFFAKAYEKAFFDRYDPTKARFRTFLRTCLDGHVANERKAASRLKRGGGATHLSLDFQSAEGELKHLVIPDDTDADVLFRREYVRDLFARSVARLKEEYEQGGKQQQLALFVKYDIEGPEAGERLTYEGLAREFQVPVTQVTNYLAAARRRFRAVVLDELRAAVGSEQEFRAEAREILGVDPP